VLLEASADAAELVVGDHNRRGLGRLLGSVASQCAHHAHCPLIVIRDESIVA
jgi:nucleotide-binding universal stress UspA family protein